MGGRQEGEPTGGGKIRIVALHIQTPRPYPLTTVSPDRLLRISSICRKACPSTHFAFATQAN